MKVLLAEDTPSNQFVALQMLNSMGADVRLAEDGGKALSMAEAEVFDVLLIDIEMPVISGLDVIRRLRENPVYRSTPIIALTGHVLREDRNELSRAGATGVIAKPIVSEEQLAADILRFTEGGGRSADTPDEPAETPEATQSPSSVEISAVDGLRDTVGPYALRDLLSRVEVDMSLAGGRLHQGVRARSVRDVREASHVLIGVAGVVGAASLGRIAGMVNERVKVEDWDGIDALMGTLQTTLAETLAFVSERKRL